jgi:glycosyltransferase involved in cell wall biosynthesis
LHILELCFSPSFGGLEIHFLEFSIWLAENKNSDERISIAVQRSKPLYSKLPGRVFFHELSYTKRSSLIFKVFKLSKFIQDNQIDLVHLHYKFDLPLLALTKILSKKKFALVYTRQMSLPFKKFDPYHKFIYSKVDKFIVITDKLKRQTVNNLPIDQSKIERIYHGCRRPPPLTIEEKKQIKEEFSAGDNFFVGNIARIEHQKGQHIFLQAIHLLKKKEFTVRGIIIGKIMDAGYKKELDTLISEYNLNVTIYDHRDDVLKILPCLDALVLTTDHETFGLSLVEGMLSEVAVVGSASGGVPEIIDHKKTGLLFRTFDPASLAENLKSIISDQIFRQKLAQAGFQKAVEKFDKDKQFSKFKNCLLQLKNPPSG